MAAVEGTPDLISTLELASEFDALDKLRPGEPHFVLLGRDKLAPQRIMDWAQANRERALQEFKDGTIAVDKRDRELRKSTQAEAVAWAMQSYKAGHMAKAAALQAQPRPSYSGAEVPAELERTDKIARARVNTAAAIHQCIADLDEAETMFRDAGCITEASVLAAERVTLWRTAEELGPPTRAQIVGATQDIPGQA